MRNYINLLESIALNEARGMGARKKGDKFSNGKETVTFEAVGIYPEGGGKFATPEERDAAVAKFEQAISPYKIEWINRPAPAMLAFGIIIFIREDGTPMYVGNYFRDVKPNIAQNQFGNQTPGGHKLATKVAAKENAGMKPSDVLENYSNLTPNDVVAQITAKFGADSYQAKAATTVLKTKGPRFPIVVEQGDMDPSAFSNYFCEMLQPIAMINGTFTGTGQACADTFFGPGGFAGATITFNEGVSGELADSLLIKDGKTIKISTKAGKGAMASSKNLNDCMKEISQTPGGKEMLSQYKQAIDVLNIIATRTGINGVIELALKYNVLSQQDVAELEKYKNVTLSDVVTPDGSVRIQNPKLAQLWKGRQSTTSDKIIPYFHLIAATAAAVCNAVNADKATQFSNAACDILNHSALVQVYTKSSAKNGQILINDFYSVWPSKTANVVKLESAKSFSSTNGNGRLVFSINGGVPAEDATVSESIGTTVDSGTVNESVYGRARRHW